MVISKSSINFARVDNNIRRVAVKPASKLPLTDMRVKSYTVRAANMLVPLELSSEM